MDDALARRRGPLLSPAQIIRPDRRTGARRGVQNNGRLAHGTVSLKYPGSNGRASRGDDPHGVEELLKRVEHEQHVLQLVDLELLRQNGIEIERQSGTVRSQGILGIGVRGYQATSVNLGLALLPN